MAAKAIVLVTAAGSIIGEGVIKCLRLANGTPSSTTNYHIIAADMSPEAAGLYRGDEGILIQEVNDSAYLDELIRMCKEFSVRAIFVGSDEEVLPLARAGQLIEKESGAKVITNPPEVIEAAVDKLRAAELMKSKGVPHAATARFEQYEDLARKLGYPLVIKPRFGHGSEGVFIAKNKEELETAGGEIQARGGEPIVQEFLEGDNEEYTTGIALNKEKVLSSIAMRRKLKHGQTYKAFVDDFPKVRAAAEKAAVALGGHGPVNVQSRMVNGESIIFEINPRFSASCPIRAVAGVNEPDLLYRNQLLGEDFSIRSYEKLVALRYWNEVYLPLETFEASSRGSVDGKRSFVPGYF